MKPKKCDLCGEDEAMADGLLCTACREAIARLLEIREHQRAEQRENDQLEQVAVYPEQTMNKRRAGS